MSQQPGILEVQHACPNMVLYIAKQQDSRREGIVKKMETQIFTEVQ